MKKYKITKEILKELGFKYSKSLNGWCYPDAETKHACIHSDFIDKFDLKKIIDFVVAEEKYRLRNSICKDIFKC